jgi:hypothetical protein
MSSSDPVPRPLRRFVSERAEHCCEYCRAQKRFAPDPFCAEHIVPRALSGPTTSDNLAWSCLGCNGLKHVRTTGVDPGTGQTVALFHPRQDRWDSHFAWDAEGIRVVGRTPTGRATIQALQLNREALLNLRRVLRDAGLHPPPFPSAQTK